MRSEGTTETTPGEEDYAEFVLQGVDMRAFTYLSWESASCPPGCSRISREALSRPLAVLERSLPGFQPSRTGASFEGQTAGVPFWLEDEEWDAVAGGEVPANVRETVSRSMSGCLMDAGIFADFLSSLMEALGLDGFIAAVKRESEAAAKLGRRVLLTLNPPPSLGQVPWELLPTGEFLEGGDAERLLDIVDVATMAPLLRRDADPSMPHPAWVPGRGLYLLRPWETWSGLRRGRASHGSVLGAGSLVEWRRRILSLGDGSSGVVGGAYGRIRLAEDLSAEERPTRLLYIGHVTGVDSNAALLLDDDASVFGRCAVDRLGYRWLSAEDLIAGTLGAGEAASDSEERSGPEIWPMPPRVGIIACHSGAESSSHEPFGLSTACLEAGAELVFATRWTMYTDLFFRWCVHLDEGEQSEAGPEGLPMPFNELAVEVDRLLRSPDPIASMNEWKRDRLRAWRKDPHDLLAAPITWAGLTVFRAPDRSVCESSAAQTPAFHRGADVEGMPETDSIEPTRGDGR